MAKWGTFKWGTSKWGAGQTPGPQPTYTAPYVWVIEIAWTGSFSGANEADKVTSLRIERGKEYFVSRNGDGLEPSTPGRASFTLDNTDGRYDPYNTSSPLYPFVACDKQVRITLRDVNNSFTSYPVFMGWISDLRPVSGSGDAVSVECVDDMEGLSRQDATVEMKFNTNTTDAITAVLDNVDYHNRDITTSDNPITLFSVEDQNAMDILNELAEGSLGQFFCDRTGKIRYYSLRYNSQPTHVIDQADVLKQFTIAQPWDEKRTRVTTFGNRWIRTTERVVWASSGILIVPGSSSIDFDISFSNPTIPITPVAGRDYSVGISNIVGGVAVPALSAQLSNVTPKSCTVTISNAATTPRDTYLKVRGSEFLTSYPVRQRRYVPGASQSEMQEVSTKVKTTVEDNSVPASLRSSFVLDNAFLQDAGFSAAYASLLLGHLRFASKNPVITMRNCATPALQFGVELQDYVTFTSAKKEIDNTYRLGKVVHEWLSPTGQDVQTTYHLINVLQSTQSIVGDGEIIIEIIDPDGGGDGDTPGGGNNPPPPTQPPDTGDPIVNCPADSPANGPQWIPEMMRSVQNTGSSFIRAQTSFVARGGATHANPSRWEMVCRLEIASDSGLGWVPGGFIPGAKVTFNAGGAGGANYEATFDLYGGPNQFSGPIILSGARRITSVIFDIPSGGEAYTTIGAPLAIVTLDPNNFIGTPVGFEFQAQRKLYGIRGISGFWRYNNGDLGPEGYIHDILNQDGLPLPYSSDQIWDDDAIPHAPYAARYFYGSINPDAKMRARATYGADGYDGRTDGLTVGLYNAMPMGNLRVTIESFMIYNVCP